jgi:hypothetical protein
MRELPIACSLGAADLERRMAEIRAVGRDALLGTGPDGSLRFRASEGIRGRLEAIVAAEAECCAFLSLDLRDAGGGELRLTISAPPEAEPVAAELASAFASR